MLGAVLAFGARPEWIALGHSFAAPLLFSPLAVIPITVAADFMATRLIPGAPSQNSTCLCVGDETIGPSSPSGDVAAAISMLTATVAPEAECRQRYVDTSLELNVYRGLDRLHLLSAAAVSPARGVNDTPKIAALLVISPLIGVYETAIVIALMIALGGLVNARRVAETMSHQITRLDPPRGLAGKPGYGFYGIASVALGHAGVDNPRIMWRAVWRWYAFGQHTMAGHKSDR
jgi:PiT family inorganic phosphate transporter